MTLNYDDSWLVREVERMSEREQAEFLLRDTEYVAIMSLDDTIEWCESVREKSEKVNWKKEGF